MKYDVLVSFTDPEDKKAVAGKNVYWAGKDQYPRDGYRPTNARIEYLQGYANKFKKPVIAAAPIIEKQPVEEKEEQ